MYYLNTMKIFVIILYFLRQGLAICSLDWSQTHRPRSSSVSQRLDNIIGMCYHAQVYTCVLIDLKIDFLTLKISVPF